MVVWLFFAVLWVCLRFVNMVFHDHTYFLSSPVIYFNDRSKAVLLLWIICVIYVLRSYFRVCSLLPCGHLPGKS